MLLLKQQKFPDGQQDFCFCSSQSGEYVTLLTAPYHFDFFTSFRVYTKLGIGPHSFLLLGKQKGGCPPSADYILPELQIIFRINLDGTLVQAVKAFIRYYNHLLC